MNITKDQLALIINKHSDFDNEGIWIPDFESAATEINNLTKTKWSTFDDWYSATGKMILGDSQMQIKLSESTWEAARKK